jgi:hypothetical protein
VPALQGRKGFKITRQRVVNAQTHEYFKSGMKGKALPDKGRGAFMVHGWQWPAGVPINDPQLQFTSV